jgi:hypothetical protein
MKKSILFLGLILLYVFSTTSLSFAITDVPKGLHSYRVQPGDTLSKLYGKKLTPALEKFIMDVNRIDSQHLVISRLILLPDNPNELPYFCPVPAELEAARSEKRKIYIFLDIQYFAAYEYGQLQFWGPISTADRQHRTPAGTFNVLGKYEKYFSHKKECLGAPMPYAIKISDSGDFLHQQAMPGVPASHGCIRLLMDDAKKLYVWAHLNDPTQIVDSMQSTMNGYVTN